MSTSRAAGLLALGAGIGAAVAYFFDPTSGRRRRVQTADKAGAYGRDVAGAASGAAQSVSAQTTAVSEKWQHREEEPKEFDDATLKNKVETEIFRDADAPKGAVDVNVQDGVVQLRGEVASPGMIEDLVEQTRRVQGVRDVENLLHVPGTAAPMHQ